MLPDRREVTFRELLLAALGAALLAVVMHWPLPLHLGETIPADLGDPLPQSWQVAWGGHALDRAALRVLPVEPVLARAGFPRLRRRADRLRARRPDRRGTARRRRPLRPPVPVRLRPLLLRRLLARQGAGAGAGRRDRGRGRLRLRPVPARAGRPHAGDLLGGHPVDARPGGPRTAPAAPLAADRRGAGRGVAGLDRVRGRAALHLSARPAGGDRRRRLVAARETRARSPHADRGARRGRDLRRHRGPDLAALLPRRRRLSRGDAAALHGRGVLGPALGLPAQLGGELGLGRRHPGPLRRGQQPGREDPVPGPADPGSGDRRPALVQPAAAAANRAGGGSPRRWRCWSWGSRRRGAGSGPTASSTTCCRAGRRSGRRGASRPSRPWRWRCWRARARSRPCARPGGGSPAARPRRPPRAVARGGRRARRRARAGDRDRGPRASRSTPPTSRISLRSTPSRPRSPTSRPPSFTCPPRGERTTAAICSGPPTASR